MAVKKFRGIPYVLWNPWTPMDTFLRYFGFGPTIITRGEGNYVYNCRGKPFINANSCTWNAALGFGQEELIEAATRQLHELSFSSMWGLSHPKAMELGAKLVDITSGNFAHVYLGANGSEVTETAMKLARNYHRLSQDPRERDRFKIISLKGGYHGLGFGAVSAFGSDEFSDLFGPLLPGFIAIDPPYCYRCPYQHEKYPECGLECAEALEKTIKAEGPQTVAAFILEPVMAEQGVIAGPPEYYQRIGKICREYGVLLIADEVTTGFGRTGKWFASQNWEIQPDILCLGKIMSGGYLPLSAMLTTEATFKRFSGKRFKSGSTHSGHPVSAAVGLAAIELIQREHLVENAARMGAYIKESFEKLKATHEIIGDVRVEGLMCHIELVKDRHTKEPYSEQELLDIVLDICLQGVLISMDGVRFFPPLNIDTDIADQIYHVLDRCLYDSRIQQFGRKLRQIRELAVSWIQ
ncbi:MAG: aminotransferase class III-fold pyridoxal phosphate-dependent enzyme [Anaerolineales bacterium]